MSKYYLKMLSPFFYFIFISLLLLLLFCCKKWGLNKGPMFLSVSSEVHNWILVIFIHPLPRVKLICSLFYLIIGEKSFWMEWFQKVNSFVMIVHVQVWLNKSKLTEKGWQKYWIKLTMRAELTCIKNSRKRESSYCECSVRLHVNNFQSFSISVAWLKLITHNLINSKNFPFFPYFSFPDKIDIQMPQTVKPKNGLFLFKIPQNHLPWLVLVPNLLDSVFIMVLIWIK